MKTLKKLTALILAVAMLCSLAACHPKDEVAISSGEYSLTSAVYSYYLLMADSEAKQKVDEAKGDTNTTPNYYKETVDGKPYEQYVREAALDACKQYLAREKMCNEAGVKLSAEQNSNIEANAETYWYSYGYSTMLEPNGISLSTYIKILKNESKYSLYFEQLYGKDGDREIPADDMNKYFADHYVAVWMPVEHDYSSTENADPEKLITEYEAYKAMLENGSTFDEVATAYKGDASSDDTSSADASSNADSFADTNETSSDATSSSEEKTPKDKNITILTDNKESYEATVFAKFSDIKALEAGKAAIIHDADSKKIYVVMKKDFSSDEYYADQFDMEARQALKSDELDADLVKVKDALKLDVNNYAIKQFEIKKIVYPTQNA